jgi:hypothetical protein
MTCNALVCRNRHQTRTGCAQSRQPHVYFISTTINVIVPGEGSGQGGEGEGLQQGKELLLLKGQLSLWVKDSFRFQPDGCTYIWDEKALHIIVCAT